MILGSGRLGDLLGRRGFDVPTNLTVTDYDWDHVDLSWTDNSGGIARTSIERQTAGIWAEISTVAPGVTVYTDTTVDDLTAYSYRVRSYIGPVYSDYSNVVNVTTLAIPIFSVTTAAPGQTLTIQGLTVSANMTVYWGDGNSDTYAGAGTRTHVYAAAGTYTVRVSDPTLVTTFDLRDSKATVTMAQLGRMTNVTALRLTACTVTGDSVAIAGLSPADFRLYSCAAGSTGPFNSADIAGWSPGLFYLNSMPAGYSGTFDSADIVGWTTADFRIYSMPAGYAGTFDSADIVSLNPTYFYLTSMPAGYAGTFDTGDLAGWNPTAFWVHTMPTATFIITISPNAFDGWLALTSLLMSNNSLTQAQVDQILDDLYDAFPSRTGTAGTINVGGTNAAPSGILQAACPPSTGKECAFELVNDSCGVSPNHWATVTITP